MSSCGNIKTARRRTLLSGSRDLGQRNGRVELERSDRLALLACREEKTRGRSLRLDDQTAVAAREETPDPDGETDHERTSGDAIGVVEARRGAGRELPEEFETVAEGHECQFESVFGQGLISRASLMLERLAQCKSSRRRDASQPASACASIGGAGAPGSPKRRHRT